MTKKKVGRPKIKNKKKMVSLRMSNEANTAFKELNRKKRGSSVQIIEKALINAFENKNK